MRRPSKRFLPRVRVALPRSSWVAGGGCHREGTAGLRAGTIAERPGLVVAEEAASPRIELEVRVDNEPAIGLYRSLGFEQRR
jgi:hypothetical protein